ncbi:universal stress protein [Halomonas organivorans]|uniref:Nucleotide-binding universal stress UspA family protein n=1 Tax=Halomonas organivorans TaxID=257772 RepID=A0A7W5G5H9_9GAMM|nr:universal stress protein [Halomonas organivorans]MBB3141154.1 nucleotide-binding universal stress UspA family protein [Halomonas organivorans]
MFQSILVPVDGSEHSRVALCVACKLARQEDGRIVLLHIPEALPHEPLLVWGAGAVPLGATLEKREQVGRELLDHAMEEARTLGVEQLTPVLTQGDPSQAILAAAEEHGVETIVMGSRGLGDLKGLVVGSVSHKVSHGAKCRVITVR